MRMSIAVLVGGGGLAMVLAGPLDPHSSPVCTAEANAPAQEKMSSQRRIARQAVFRRRISREQPTLKELLDAPSTFSWPTSNGRAPVTVILNHFQRHTVCRQLDALLSQTAPPAHIWVCLFASPMAAAARAAALSYNDSRIAVFESEHNLKYYGRFQMAAAAPTKYVLVFDDDMVPGTRFIASMRCSARNWCRRARCPEDCRSL